MKSGRISGRNQILPDIQYIRSQWIGFVMWWLFVICTVVYISEKQLLVLNFRGLSFEFRIDPKLEVSDEPNELVLMYS